MGWKKWPSWVKGGVIGVIFYIILFIITFASCFETGIGGLCKNKIFELLVSPGSVIQLPFNILFDSIIYFLLGALIGWLVGKFRKK